LLFQQEGMVNTMDALQPLMTAAAGTDLAGDGQPEIVSLAYAGTSVRLGEPDPKRRLVLVLVEARLLQTPRFQPPVKGRPTLLSRLNRLVADIRREGDDCRLVSADLYQGPVQKDGRVLLALRRFLQQARDRVGLTSVVMIGRFPEAQILRRFPWAPAFERTIAGVATNGRRYLAVDPELVAGSADIVLADMTGHWEDVYQPTVTTRGLYLLPTGFNTTSADWLRLNDEIKGTVVELQPETTTSDVFYLDEALIDTDLTGPVARDRIRRFRSDPEVTAANRTRPNPIAFPEITVSRINAYHVGVQLPGDRSMATGKTGQILSGGITDTDGKPSTFTSTVNYATEPTSDPAVWVIRPDEFVPDPALERQLINEYLDRNHRFRTGIWPTRPGSIAAVAHPASDGFTAAAAADVLERALPGAARTLTQDPTPAEYATAWGKPGLLRAIVAHSDAHLSAYRATTSTTAVDNALGAQPFRWWQTEPNPGRTPREFTYVPTTRGIGGTVDLRVHRTLWQNDKITDIPSIVVHNGCGATTPDTADTATYTDPAFGRWQNAESILFYAGCLALLGRSKIFNDDGHQFVDGLTTRGAKLGRGWANIFAADGLASPEGADIGEQAARCKKSYPWNLLGDCTLPLHPAP
jgi:hypothetical protein